MEFTITRQNIVIHPVYLLLFFSYFNNNTLPIRQNTKLFNLFFIYNITVHSYTQTNRKNINQALDAGHGFLHSHRSKCFQTQGCVMTRPFRHFRGSWVIIKSWKNRTLHNTATGRHLYNILWECETVTIFKGFVVNIYHTVVYVYRQQKFGGKRKKNKNN